MTERGILSLCNNTQAEFDQTDASQRLLPPFHKFSLLVQCFTLRLSYFRGPRGPRNYGA